MLNDRPIADELILLPSALILHKEFTVALARRYQEFTQGEAPMRQLAIVSAAIAIAALVSAIPASADWIAGGPIKQNGQCWKNHQGNEQRFGAWIACPKPAAAPATQRATRRRV
jgi:hypothetical protein